MKKLLALLKEPNGVILAIAWGSALLSVAGALTFVFIGYAGVFSYLVYGLAAVTLGYTVYTLVRFAPKIKGRVQELFRRGRVSREFMENYGFRTLVFALCSFVVNLGFVAFNTVFAVLTANGWYASLAGYYFLLSVLRGCVFLWERKAKQAPNEWEYERVQYRNYGLCGGALFLLDIAMAVAVTFMVLDGKPTKYTEVTAIVFAVYSVYKISLAIYHVFKARETRNMQVQAFRNIGLVDAAVSLLSLQVTLISTFSTDGQNMALLNALTGAFVCLLAIGVGVFMIIRAIKKRKEERYE